MSSPQTKFDQFKADLIKHGADLVPEVVNLSDWLLPDLSLSLIEDYSITIELGTRALVEWVAELSDRRRIRGGVAYRDGGKRELYVSSIEVIG